MTEIPAHINALLQQGTVIPAHPLALDAHLKIDRENQAMLTRYYIASGAGGVAVGVHTTQFEIRNPGVDLLDPVLKITAEEIAHAELQRPFIKVAGIVGRTDAALREVEVALKYGYHLGLVSMGGLPSYSESELIKRIETIAERIPVFGFYLQPAVGGRVLSYQFWRDFADIPNVHAIKIAAFNRYQTIDVVRAVCHSQRRNEIALYTGNDDNIVADLLTPYRFLCNGKMVEKKIVGGLLGHWAVWTKRAVEIFEEIKKCFEHPDNHLQEMLALGAQITDMNAAVFDVNNSFRGSIAGIHEALRRQGLMKGIWCLNPDDKLSPGQAEEIERVSSDYPHLTDDNFVKDFLQSQQTN